jgi:hypothetical protein
MIFKTNIYTIELPSEYGAVGLVAALIIFQYLVSNFGVVGNARKKTFTKEFLAQFESEHTDSYNSYGVVPPKMLLGVPDTGNGWYSQKLTYFEWFKFNIARRQYLNTLEVVTPAISWLLIAGLYFP